MKQYDLKIGAREVTELTRVLTVKRLILVFIDFYF